MICRWFHTHSNLKEKVSDGSAVRDSQARGIHFVLFFLLNLVHIDVLHNIHVNILHAV